MRFQQFDNFTKEGSGRPVSSYKPRFQEQNLCAPQRLERAGKNGGLRSLAVNFDDLGRREIVLRSEVVKTELGHHNPLCDFRNIAAVIQGASVAVTCYEHLGRAVCVAKSDGIHPGARQAPQSRLEVPRVYIERLGKGLK